jgi:hypothetical protein
MPTHISHRESIDTKAVIGTIVATEAVIRNAVAVVAPPLLPGAVLRLPAARTITPPSDPLLPFLRGAPWLCRPNVTFLTLLVPLLILLRSGLLLPARGLVLLLPPLMLLLTPGLLLFTSRGIVLLLKLVVLLPSRLLLLFPGVVFSLRLLLPLPILLPLGLLLLFRPSLLLLPFRLGPLLVFPGLGFFFLFSRVVLPRVSRRSDSEDQKKRRRVNNSNRFHVLPPSNSLMRRSLS